MRRFLLPLFFLIMMFLGGCAILDTLFGTNEQGEQKPSILNTIVTTALNGLFPGSGAAITGLGGLYAAYRANRWKKAFTSTAEVIEEHGDLPKAAIKEKLEEAHEEAGVQKMVQGVVKNLATSTTQVP